MLRPDPLLANKYAKRETFSGIPSNSFAAQFLKVNWNCVG
jgi:hypothetical protein